MEEGRFTGCFNMFFHRWWGVKYYTNISSSFWWINHCITNSDCGNTCRWWWAMFCIENQKLCLTSVQFKQVLQHQGPKLRLPGRQCDQKFSSGDQNFIAGRQLATCKAGCYCRLSRSEKMIKNWNLEAICQQVSYFLSCWYFFNLKVKRIFL